MLSILLTAPLWVSALGDALNSVTGGGGGGPGGAGASATATAATSPAGNQVPVISARAYVSGSAPASVSGAFGIAATIALDPQASFSDGTETTLSYGFNEESGGLLLELSRAEGSGGLGLNISAGPWTANYLGEGCDFRVAVTETTLSGHVSCEDLPAVNEEDGTTGTVDVELDFEADS